VAVIEADKIIEDVTGHTTAKLTSLQGLRYHYYLKYFSPENVKAYAEANEKAISYIEENIKKENISCDFEKTEAYTYTTKSENIKSILDELEAVESLGLPATFTKETKLPFAIKAAIKFEKQAKFHPRKYLLELAKKIESNGGYIFEKTTAVDIEDASPCIVKTDKGVLTAKQVIIATQFPFWDKGLFYQAISPFSYVVGAKLDVKWPSGVYFSPDENFRSIRGQKTDDENILIVGRQSHKSGQGGNNLEHYKIVEKFTKDNFDVSQIKYYWSTMDYDTEDGMPYIGKSPKAKNVYLATGFGGWGMTNGTISAYILRDLILGEDNPFAFAYDPFRKKYPKMMLSQFLSQNLNVAGQYAKGLLDRNVSDPSKLKNGEGDVFDLEEKKTAISKDLKGNIKRISSKCTHFGCVVNWNNAELTWDCPCHGSRFRCDGKVVHGPALEDLKEE